MLPMPYYPPPTILVYPPPPGSGSTAAPQPPPPPPRPALLMYPPPPGGGAGGGLVPPPPPPYLPGMVRARLGGKEVCLMMIADADVLIFMVLHLVCDCIHIYIRHLTGSLYSRPALTYQSVQQDGDGGIAAAVARVMQGAMLLPPLGEGG